MRQRLKGIGDIDDARFERQGGAADMEGIALPIRRFVMVIRPARQIIDGSRRLSTWRVPKLWPFMMLNSCAVSGLWPSTISSGICSLPMSWSRPATSIFSQVILSSPILAAR